MEQKYNITVTREQYIVIRESVKAELARAFMEDDKLSVEMLQGAYQAIIGTATAE